MTIYSHSFFAGAVRSSGQTIIATVPAGQTAVIRDIEIVSSSTSPTNLSIFIQRSGITAGFLTNHEAVAYNSWIQWLGRVVLMGGDELVTQVDSTPIWYVVSGYLFDS